MKIAVFTISAKNYLPRSRTLLASLATHHPDVDRYLVLSDRIDGAFDPEKEDFEVVEAEALAVDELAEMAFFYDVTEFSTAIKPAAFEHVFERGPYDAVVYLDPDVYVVGRLEELLAELAAGAEAVLTPHVCAPIEDGLEPGDRSMLRSGVYNLGFLALARSDESRRFLEWWRRRLVSDCRVDLEEGLFVDQKWADLLPCFVGGTRILRHPGYNVAYWNLMHRKISVTDGTWTANDEPLRFLHLSGLPIDDPRTFSIHQTRYASSDIGELSELVDEYRRAVTRAGRDGAGRLPYAYGSAGDERAIPDVLRRLCRASPDFAARLRRDPTCTRAAWRDLAAAYATEPAPGPTRGRSSIVTRLMAHVWGERPDLRDAFDLHGEAGRRAYVAWFHSAGVRELDLPADLVCPTTRRRDGIRPGRSGPPTEAGVQRVAGSRVDRSLGQRAALHTLSNAHRLKSLYLRLPVPLRHRVKTRLLRVAYRSPSLARDRSELPIGARLVGYPRAELGMGEHVRLSGVALDAVKFPFALYDFSANVVARQRDDRFAEWIDNAVDYNVNVFHVNADQMEVARESLGPDFFAGHHNVGYWAWELPRFPSHWKPAIDLVDEVWAPSRFVQDSIGRIADRPVIWMPIAVDVHAPPSIDRRYFHLPRDRFLFLFHFDFSSYAARKNPRAVLEAFRRAFGRERRDVMLVLKTMAQGWHREALESLRAEIADDPRIRLIDSVLSPAEIAGLVDACDAYVSLHRSEGFGRGMAEAMALGKPVIATNYSGNTDFMTEQTACLVDYDLIPVEEGEYPHHRGQVWADPDLEQAADAMRRLVDDPARARALGARARRHIQRGWGPRAVGARMIQRLREGGLA